jgi:basic amino acid/polyamine antiporter, APA family
MSDVSVTSPTAVGGGFARKASGLVRSFSPTDALFYNILAINPFLVAQLSFTTMAVAFLGANLWLAILICGTLCIPEAIVYAQLTTLMPRSGGDYVFQSRILGGGVATFFTFSGIILAEVAAVLLVISVGLSQIFAPFLTTIGAYYHSHALVSVATWLGGKTGFVVSGFAILAWIAIINYRGLRIYAIVQRWVFYVAAGGLLAVFAIMLFSTHADFVNGLNSFMRQHYGVKDAYHSILSASHVHAGFSFSATMYATVLAAFAFIFPAWGVMQAGEIKRAGAGRTNLFSIVGAEIISVLIALAAVLLLLGRVGSDFLVAAGNLSFNDPSHYPLPVSPFFGFFASMIHASPPLAWLVFVTSFAWFWMWAPNLMVATTRVLIAMSFDRMLPEWLGKVSLRSRAPVNAITVTVVGCAAFIIVYVFVTSLITLLASLVLLTITCFAVTMVAGGLLPWVRPDLYKQAPGLVRARVLGVPLITVSGAIFFAYAVFVDYACLSQDALGVNSTKGLVFVGGVYAVSAAVYLSAAYYRKKKDRFDLSIMYRELPVE